MAFISMQQAIRMAREFRKSLPSPEQQIVNHDGVPMFTPSQVYQRHAERMLEFETGDDGQGLMSGWEDDG